MYVVPYLMGPPGSPFAKVGVELTDSIYVALNMRIMTRMGTVALDVLGDSDDFNRGTPFHARSETRSAASSATFPRTTRSGRSGAATAATRCSARSASRCASQAGSGKREGWLAEHMLILGLQSPQGETTYVAAAFPSACGKTNLAMLTPPRSFRRLERIRPSATTSRGCASDRTAGYGRSIPEAGYFGVAPGTNARSNPNAMKHGRARHDLHQRGDDAGRRRVVGGHGRRSSRGTHRLAGDDPGAAFGATGGASEQPLHHADDEQSRAVAARRRSRRACQSPRSSLAAVARPRFRWCLKPSIGTTASIWARPWVPRPPPPRPASGPGAPRSDGDAAVLRLQHGQITSRTGSPCGPRLKRSPKIFMVNWFSKDAGRIVSVARLRREYLRVLKWIVDRVDGRAAAEDKPVGLVPRTSDINLEGLEMASERLRAAMAIERDDWSAELRSQDEFFYRLDCELPREIEVQHETLAAAFEL